MSQYIIEDTTLTGIANAIRDMRQETGSMTPAQMISKLNNTRLGVPVVADGRITEDGHWIRPNNYPDLDELYETIGDDESCVYLTYDLTKTPDYGWVGLYATGSTWNVARGHVSNGEFVADWTSETLSSGDYFRQALDSNNGDIQLWKLYSSGHISRIAFCTNATSTAESMANGNQPCVERCGRIPYVTSMVGNANTTTYTTVSFGTKWLYRDYLDAGKNSCVTSLNSMYSYCHNLVETNCGEWDTSGWIVTSLQYAFYLCESLQVLDLSGWDTSEWKVTSIADAWDGCVSLRILDVSTWDTSNWTTLTSMATAWYRCMSLQELDLSNWDVSNWSITQFNSVWYYCCSLKKLDVSTWDTENWAVTRFDYAWYRCTSLVKLPIENWNTDNWAVTRFNNAWNDCVSLQNLDLSKWDTSNWTVTYMTNAWNGCESLASLNVSTWDTSSWTVDSLENVWYHCYSLKDLDVSKWTTTSWAVTSLYSTWFCCYSLKTFTPSSWNTSNWVVTTLFQAMGYCTNIEEFNLTGWNTSKWTVTSVYSLFCYTLGARTIDISTWDISKFALTDARNLFSDSGAEVIKFPAGLHGSVANSKFTANMFYLTYYSGMDIDVDMNISNSTRLTRASLTSIISRLPTVTSKTLTIGQSNKLKLTAEEIAVATQKGWTVA